MIIVFSGCGNTAATASRLAAITGDETVRLSPAVLRAEAPVLKATGTRIVWAFPTYSWGVPPVVRRFMRRVRLDGADRLTHLMLTTCGDDIGDCAAMWRADVSARGWEPGRAFSVQMPNTYVTMPGFDVDTPAVAEAKVAAMPARVSEIAAELDRPGPDLIVRGSWPWVKTRIIYPWFVRMGMSPRPFHATERCTGCGACARRCPMANIALDADRRPRWSTECAFCLGCYHACPTGSVAYGRATRGKGQWPGIRTRHPNQHPTTEPKEC
ncbi:MAG: EFR1 family ferrodoxin [Muribaculaceae bacterium]|nr:EFR1 family ferrodoxin [Muribaculaceae bacterium]